jgi:DNA-binding NtrC family response regulator
MGGGEAFQEIKAVRTDVPVLISSGYGDTEVARLFAGKETAGFLHKPYTVSELMEAVAIVLGRI